MPNIQQVFVKIVKEENVDDIERELYICRKLIEKAVSSESWGNELYFCSYISSFITSLSKKLLGFRQHFCGFRVLSNFMAFEFIFHC